PCGQRAQCFRVAAKHSPCELVLPIDFNVGDDHVQHPFMDIDSCCLIGHLFLLLAGAESMPRVSLVRVTSYRRSPRETNAKTLNYSLNTHAPDQTNKRPRRIHCRLDLAAPSRNAY